MDPIDFLRQHPPFDALSEDSLSKVARALEIAYVERGQRVLSHGGEPSSHLHVLRKGSVTLELDNQSLDELTPGEAFGYASLVSGKEPRFDVVAQQDCLLYRLPAKTFRSLLETEPRFGEFFLTSLAERLRLATEREPLPLAGDLATPAGKLISGPPVSVSAAATVGEAARVMRQNRVSSILLAPAEEGALPVAILTDRDLRCRVLAEDRGPESSALEAASQPLQTLPATTPLFDALVFSLRHRVHHLPLTEGDRVVGV
ncbi:MAG: cyclic nucleotide-binding domain-containing protein, partial [Acidobacteria bacterium]|nr:cyclic nucleotide-binding domain-containing protein [Acidobacteriota bacterium]